MQAGLLRHRVTLRSPVDAQNPTTGALTRSWTDEGTVWADVRYQKGLEAISAATTIATVKCSIRIRFRDDVAPAWQIGFNGQDFDIKAVLPDPTGHRYLDLACEV